MIIAVTEETSQSFKDFAEEYENSIVYIEHKAFVGITEVVDIDKYSRHKAGA